jgi:hypothetical protein
VKEVDNMRKLELNWPFLIALIGLSVASGVLGVEAQRWYRGTVGQPAGLSASPLEFPSPSEIAAREMSGAPATLSLNSSETALLLFVLSVDCPWCERNMTNWVRITSDLEENSPGRPLQSMVLSTSDAIETEAYLERHGLRERVVLVDSRALAQLGATGYPTTIFKPMGEPHLYAWKGVLSPQMVDSIMLRISSDVK